MPFALVIIGLVMIVSGARDTYAALGKELVEDFTGPGNFTYWLVALGFLGALGSIPQFKNFSRAFMALALVAMVINNRGVFAKLTEALKTGPVKPGDEAKLVGQKTTAGQPAPAGAGDPLAFGFTSGDAKGNFFKALDIGLKLYGGF